MSDTSSVNMINLQVMAEDIAQADKADGTYDANRAIDSKYYLWHGDLQTYPLGMDGNPEQFAAKMREALPTVTTLRLPFNEYSFDENGHLHEQYERFLHAAAAQGFDFDFVYAGGDAQRYGSTVDTADEVYDALSGDIYSGIEQAWGNMLDLLDANPDVKDAVYGMELVNEPAAYASGADKDGADSTRFQELYANQMNQLADMIDGRVDAKILVGGWRYSATFDELDVGDINGQTAMDAIRSGIGDDLVWSAHLYPGWAGTGHATTSDELAGILEEHFSPVIGDDVIITETNAKGSEADNVAEIDSSTFLFVRSYEWFAENGIGLSWFPGVETGASNFVVIDGNGTLRYLHQSSIAHGLDAYSLDEHPEELLGDDNIVTDLVSGAIRNESYQPEGRTFDDTQGMGFGFGYDGNDTITGRDEANDLAYGGTGNDIIFGKGGDDHLFGQYGNDTLQGGDGDDHLFGGDGDDRLDAGAGFDQMTGGDGADTFVASDGHLDIVDFNWNDGDRYENFGEAVDLGAMLERGERSTIEGRESDLVITTRVSETVFAKFFDTNADAIAALTPPLPVGQTVTGSDNGDLIDSAHPGENGMAPGEGADTITAGTGDDVIYSSGGDDIIDANDGNDVIYSEGGDDVISAGRGDDTVYGGAGSDTIWAVRGDDVISSGDGDDVIDAGYDNSTIDAGADNDQITANLTRGGYHRITTGDGHDQVYLETGSDEKYGRATITDFNAAEDTIIIDGVELSSYLPGALSSNPSAVLADGNSTVIQVTPTSSVTIDGYTPQQLADALQITLDPAGSLAEDVITDIFTDSYGHDVSQASDYVQGTDGDDLIQSGAGNDYINGGDGQDQIFAGSGNDVIYGHNGNDLIYGGSGDDNINGGSGSDTIFGDDGNDFIETGYHLSTVDGGNGDDVIYADISRGARHVLTGGEGADSFVFIRESDRDSASVITDFDANEDSLDISTFLSDGGTFAYEAHGDDVLLSFSTGDTILLEGVTTDQIDPLASVWETPEL